MNYKLDILRIFNFQRFFIRRFAKGCTVAMSRYQPFRTLNLVQKTKQNGILLQGEKTATAWQLYKNVQKQKIFNIIAWKISGKP